MLVWKFERIFTVILLTIFSIGAANAEKSLYITDKLNAYLLKGPNSSKYGIAFALQAGAPVTLVSTSHNYSLVKDSKNRQGWINSDLLSENPDKTTMVASLTQEVNELKFKLDNINKTWEQKTSDSSQRIIDLEQQNKDLFYKNNALQDEIAKYKRQTENLSTILDKEKSAIATRWFIFGGSVLGVGLILGLILPSIMPRRKKERWR